MDGTESCEHTLVKLKRGRAVHVCSACKQLPNIECFIVGDLCGDKAGGEDGFIYMFPCGSCHADATVVGCSTRSATAARLVLLRPSPAPGLWPRPACRHEPRYVFFEACLAGKALKLCSSCASIYDRAVAEALKELRV